MKIINGFISGSIMLLFSAYLNDILDISTIEFFMVVLTLGLLFNIIDDNGVESIVEFANTIVISIVFGLLVQRIFFTPIQFSFFLIILYIFISIQIILFRDKIVRYLVNQINS